METLGFRGLSKCNISHHRQFDKCVFESFEDRLTTSFGCILFIVLLTHFSSLTTTDCYINPNTRILHVAYSLIDHPVWSFNMIQAPWGRNQDRSNPKDWVGPCSPSPIDQFAKARLSCPNITQQLIESANKTRWPQSRKGNSNNLRFSQQPFSAARTPSGQPLTGN